MHFSWVSHLSLVSVIDSSLTYKLCIDGPSDWVEMLIDQDPPPSHFLQFLFFFQLRIVENRLKVLVMMVKLQIFIGALISLYCKNLISFMY